MLNKFKNYVHIKWFLSTIILIICKIWGQEIPQDFLLYQTHKLNFNLGQNWDRHSIFGPLRWQQIQTEKLSVDSLYFNCRVGYLSLFDNSNITSSMIYINSRLVFNKNFYAYMYPRVVSDPSSFSRFSGLPRKISRFGFNAGGDRYSWHWL